MDSRFRGNDGGEAHILRENSFEIPANFTKIGTRRICRRKWNRAAAEMTAGKRRTFAKKVPRNSRENKKKPPSFPRKRESITGKLIFRNFRTFYAKIKFEIPANFTQKNGVNAGICRRKWIPAFAGMTAGRREFGGKNRTAADGENVGVNAGICRRKCRRGGNRIGDGGGKN